MIFSFGLIFIIFINFIYSIAEGINYVPSLFRHKREQQSLTYPPIYHICGNFPNFVYSLLPCQVCRNGGRSLNLPCTSPIQCVIYYTQGATECIDSQCCTAISSLETSNVQPSIHFEQQNGQQQNNYLIEEQIEGYCPNNERSKIRCSAAGQCSPSQECLNGICCPQSPNNYLEACGGQIGIERCDSGTCSNGLVCTASRYCCQCKVGRSAGYCNMGACQPGYQCQSGYCCASCPDNTMTFGVCTAGDSTNYNLQYTNGQRQLGCPVGYKCLTGDICCKQ
uniref:Uncharacterized protein n=1 Tax=Meloidogyne incognita TaxID=6306 RepID=A0A914NAD2_MELIC